VAFVVFCPEDGSKKNGGKQLKMMWLIGFSDKRRFFDLIKSSEQNVGMQSRRLKGYPFEGICDWL